MDKPERKDAGEAIVISEEVTEQSVIDNELNATTTEKMESNTNLGKQFQYKFDCPFHLLNYHQ